MDLDKVLYGGDYNPEQWLDRPDILEEDIAMMQEAHIRLAYRSFWQRHPVPDHSGWQRNTQRCSV